MPKPTPIYRPLLHDAWKITWERKSLWVFGLFAAVISSGGVIDVAISGLRQATASGNLLEHLIDRSFIGYAYISQFLLQLQKINQSQFIITLVLITLLGVGLICAGIISQAALIHGAEDENKHPHLIRRHVIRHFWDVFLIDAATKILSLLLIVLTTLPIFFYLSQATTFASNVLFVHFLIFIPVIIVLHILSMLSIVSVVDQNMHALPAIEQAIAIFKKHWLATIEYGFILFAIVFSSALLFIGLLSLLSVPYSLIYNLSLFSGSTILFILVNILFAFVVTAIFLCFGGIAVTFQYTAWRTFHKRAIHRTFGFRPFSKIWRALFA